MFYGSINLKLYKFQLLQWILWKNQVQNKSADDDVCVFFHQWKNIGLYVDYDPQSEYRENC